MSRALRLSSVRGPRSEVLEWRQEAFSSRYGADKKLTFSRDASCNSIEGPRTSDLGPRILPLNQNNTLGKKHV